MKNYEVTGRSVSVHTGTLRLTPEQAQRRHHALEDLGKGLYLLTKPTMFKKGDVFGFDGDLPKAAVKDVTTTEKPVRAASRATTKGVATEAAEKATRTKRSQAAGEKGKDTTPAPTPQPTKEPA